MAERVPLPPNGGDAGDTSSVLMPATSGQETQALIAVIARDGTKPLPVGGGGWFSGGQKNEHAALRTMKQKLDESTKQNKRAATTLRQKKDAVVILHEAIQGVTSETDKINGAVIAARNDEIRALKHAAAVKQKGFTGVISKASGTDHAQAVVARDKEVERQAELQGAQCSAAAARSAETLKNLEKQRINLEDRLVEANKAVITALEDVDETRSTQVGDARSWAEAFHAHAQFELTEVTDVVAATLAHAHVRYDQQVRTAYAGTRGIINDIGGVTLEQHKTQAAPTIFTTTGKVEGSGKKHRKSTN